MEKEIYLWRNTVKTASQDGKAFEFCRQNSILGVGWCLRNPDGTLSLIHISEPTRL